MVTFKYEVQGQTAVTYTWTNGSGDPTNTIKNDATGYFHCDIPTNVAGVWSWQWASHPSSGIDTTGTTVVSKGTMTVSPPSVT